MRPEIAVRGFAIEDIQALARSHDEFLAPRNLVALPEALLPSEFLAMWLEKIDPDWVGAYAVIGAEVVGTAGFKGSPDPELGIEFGYGTAPAAEGRGVATALAHHMAEYALERGLPQVYAQTLPDGLASQRVLLKNGFEFSGEIVDPEDGLVHRYVKRRG